MGPSEIPTQLVWGPIEVLGCYASRSDCEELRQLPSELADHVAANVELVPPSEILASSQTKSLQGQGPCQPPFHVEVPADALNIKDAARKRLERGKEKDMARPGKATRRKCKALAAKLAALDPESVEMHEALKEALASGKSYFSSILRGYASHYDMTEQCKCDSKIVS
eukprot:TRINITY_DN33759_c0_g1_i1.p1 TRINITY_DN33759_c0_g1~~TRINITY_DN33759_c0_g1_i1.p1  ORF type:complete len:185 (+),score=31.13 TRINITY_DN33759_c0_g1_i1:54-557(+)